MYRTSICQQQYLDTKLTFQYVFLQPLSTSLLILMEKLLRPKVDNFVVKYWLIHDVELIAFSVVH